MAILSEIIKTLNVKEVIGNENIAITSPIQLNIKNRNKNVIMWASPKYYDSLKQVERGVIICEEIKEEDISFSCTYILVENARGAFREVLERFFTETPPVGIAESARIASGVLIEANVFIGENVVIEKGVIIRENTYIGHNTVIKRNTIIGANVKIGSNNVIGGVGFGYEKNKNGEYVVMPHIGNVIIEDAVEIGNCSTIDRAVMGSTILKRNSKVDNLVHIAHGVILGENSLVIANAMIAGSVEIGKNVWVAPSSSILNKVTIADNALIGMGAVVLKHVKVKEIIIGNPGKVLVKK